MASHPNHGRVEPNCSVDFEVPCVPDLHAMPKDVQAAGAKIRREIQRRYRKISYEAGCDHITQDIRPARRAVQGKPPASITPPRGERAQAAYDALVEAYHAWSNTASRGTPYRPDPDLLRYVCECDGPASAWSGDC